MNCSQKFLDSSKSLFSAIRGKWLDYEYVVASRSWDLLTRPRFRLKSVVYCGNYFTVYIWSLTLCITAKQTHCPKISVHSLFARKISVKQFMPLLLCNTSCSSRSACLCSSDDVINIMNVGNADFWMEKLNKSIYLKFNASINW
jgi:hypothetical protein